MHGERDAGDPGGQNRSWSGAGHGPGAQQLHGASGERPGGCTSATAARCQIQTNRAQYRSTRNQWRNANACWANQRNIPRMQGAPSICHLLVILQPILQSYKHPKDQDAAVGKTSLPSTQRRLKTLWASRFVGWIHVNTQRRFRAANSSISGCENTTYSQAAEHPQMFSREQYGPTNLSIFGSSSLTKLCL